ncbi:MAG: AAA family ATPase, partial [Candidatus Hodarchaeota archaeon]
MIEEVKKAIFSASNPFRKTNVKSAWEDDIFDVESFNAKCFNEILREIEEISRKEYRSFIHLILGEVGLGKTHLLARLRKKAIEKNFYFVEIEPVPNLDKFYMHILREFSSNLRKKIPDSDFTFLEELVANLLFQQMEKALKGKKDFKKLLNELRKSPTKIFKLKISEKELNDIKDIMIFKISRDYPGIEVQLIQILFEAINPRKFLYAIKWLQCESLSEEEMELIGATISIEEENIAFNVLKSLLELTDKIVVFAFDQIESIEKSFGIVGLQKFFQMIVNIYNTCKNHLSTIMVQTGVWNTFVRDNLDQSVIDRIENTSTLDKLTIEQSGLIIEKRMDLVWKRAKIVPSNPLYPFTEKVVEDLSKKSAWNPRKLIRNAGVYFKEVQASDAEITPTKIELDEDIAKDENEFILKTLIDYEDKYHVEYMNSSADKREDVIISTISHLFEGMKKNNINFHGIDVVEVYRNLVFERGKKGINLLLRLRHSNLDKKIGIECSNASNMTKLYHSLNRLINFSKESYYDNYIFLREKDLLISQKATRTINLVETIKSQGGYFEIDNKVNLKLYALKRLLDSASAKELSYKDKSFDFEEVCKILVDSYIKTLKIFEELFRLIVSLFNIKIDIDSPKENEKENKINSIQYTDDLWNFIQEKRILGFN